MLAGVFVAVWLVDRGRHASAITVAGGAVFALAALGWAPRLARASVTGEVVGGSWDFQRLTALSPWTLAWGKLAGSTARPWATAAGGLVLAALQLASTRGLRVAGFWVVVAVALGVTLQASGLATGLIDIRRSRVSGRPLSARAPGLAILALALVSLAVLVWLRSDVGEAVRGFASLGRHGRAAAQPLLQVPWGGRSWPPLGFSAVTLLGLAAWSLVWAWRLMRLELLAVNAPWAWIVFLLCTGAYVIGFDPPADAAAPRAMRLTEAAIAWAALAYVAAFAGPADRVRARQFTAAVQGRRAGRILSHLPLTAAPAALALLAGLAAAALRARAGEAGAALVMLAALAFFGRDLGLIAWRRFATWGLRGDAAVLLLLLGLYLVGPPLGWIVARGRGAAAFWPATNHPREAFLAALVEAALAWGFAALAVAARPAPRPRPPEAPETAVPVTTKEAAASTPPPHEPWS